MIKPMATKLGIHRWRFLVLSFSILVLVGCGQDKVIEVPATAVPVQSPTQVAVEPLATTAPVPVSIPDAAPARTPDSAASTSPSQPPTSIPATKETVAEPAATSAPSFETSPLPPTAEPVFELLSPANATVSEVGVIRGLGNAEPGAWAIVNGTPVAVGTDGAFRFDLPLDEGPNTIEVSVANAGGRTQTRTNLVSFVPSESTLPFSLFYPLDGVQNPPAQHSGIRCNQAGRSGGNQRRSSGRECVGDIFGAFGAGRRGKFGRGNRHGYRWQRSVWGYRCFLYPVT